MSGFSPTGTREYLPGMADQSIVVQFENDFAATSVHATLQPIFTSGAPTGLCRPGRNRCDLGDEPGLRRPGLPVRLQRSVRRVERTLGDNGDVQAGTRLVVPVGRRRPHHGRSRDAEKAEKAPSRCRLSSKGCGS